MGFALPGNLAVVNITVGQASLIKCNLCDCSLISQSAAWVWVWGHYSEGGGMGDVI